MSKFKVVILDYGGVIFDPTRNELVHGAMGLIKFLKEREYATALVSKAESVGGRWEDFERLGLSDKIDFLNVFPLDKPKSFNSVLDKFNVEPKDCIVLGDYVKSEIAEGNKLGMTTVWYKHGEFPNVYPESEEEKPDYEIESIEEFRKYV